VVKVVGSADKRLLSPGGGDLTQERSRGTRTDQSRNRPGKKKKTEKAG